MIFYFSGTGNSKWVAQEIANRIHDTAVDIMGYNQVLDFQKEEQIGFVFPIYAWGVPEPMLNFVKKLPNNKNFTFAVCTCGADAGLAMKELSKVYFLHSSYSILMPSNYIIGENVEKEDIIKFKINKAKDGMENISKEIQQKKSVYRVTEGKLAFLKSKFGTAGFEKFARSTSLFYADDRCVSCGICEIQCPAKTIIIRDRKPVWGEACYQCLKCIHTCPEHAIQYGKHTSRRGRYTIDKWVKKINTQI